MEVQINIVEALARLDLGPLRVAEASADDDSAPVLLIEWASSIERFVVEKSWARSPGEVKGAAVNARHLAERTGLTPILIVPYLSDQSLAVVREEGINGIDLSGNGTIEIPERWWFFQKGHPNRYPRKRRSRAPYRGRSALVGRALLVRPRYETVGEIKEEIEKRGGSLSLSQVSKVLSALEDDLVIRKTSEEIRLLQPAKLLDALVEDYRIPEPIRTLEAKVEIGPQLFGRLTDRARGAGVKIAGFEPQRYVVAPESRERLTIYVEPGKGLDLVETFDVTPAARFANLVIQTVEEPGVFFDTLEADGFRWCSPLEVYLQLMQGGKREQEAARQLRESLLEQASGEQ